MRVFVTGMMLAGALAVSACAGNTSRPTDTGSMQAPTPYRASTPDPTTQSRDVGSMAAPRATGGFVEHEPIHPDTGNMALPPAANGNSTPAKITP